MKTVNYWYIDGLLAPIFVNPDDDQFIKSFHFPDANDESEVKRVLNAQIKPCFMKFDRETQEHIKDTLQYYLSSIPNENTKERSHFFSALFGMASPAFTDPGDPRLFFVWLWEVLYGSESYLIDDYRDYVENNDAQVIIRTYR